MSRHYYRRRYYGRRKSNSSEGILGIVVVVSVLIYAYDPDWNLIIHYATFIGLIISLIFFVFYLWQRRKAVLKHAAFELAAKIDTMTGLEFEKYVAALLKKQGYTGVRLTEYYDLGVDIIARKDGITWGVQVKRCSGMVKAAAARQVVTALKHYKCDRAMVITNGIYSRPAIRLAESNECSLIDRMKLASMASLD